MKKAFKRKILFFIIFLILLESTSRCFLFFYNVRSSYQINKGYYNFQGTFWEYLKVYRNFIKKYHNEDRVIVRDIFNRQFYIPNLNLELDWIKIRTNSFGMKEKYLDLQKKDNTYRIICLGSSYTLSGSEGNTFTALLEKKLNEKYKEKKFEIINAGISGQGILESFMTFSLNWRMLNPDVIIIDHVLADVWSGAIPFYLKNYGKITEDKFINYSIKKKFKKYIGVCGVIDLIYSKFTPRYNRPTEEALAYYETLLESLVLLAKGMGGKVALLSCGIAVDRDHNFDEENHKRKMLELRFPRFTANAIVHTIEEYNKIMKKVARKNDVIFFDMSEVVPKDDEYFMDATHRSDKGNEVFADILMDKLIASNLFD